MKPAADTPSGSFEPSSSPRPPPKSPTPGTALRFRLFRVSRSGGWYGPRGGRLSDRRAERRSEQRFWGPPHAGVRNEGTFLLSPFPSYKLRLLDQPGAVKGACFARRSEPLTARSDLESCDARERGFLPTGCHLPTLNLNPEDPRFPAGPGSVRRIRTCSRKPEAAPRAPKAPPPACRKPGTAPEI